MMGEIIALNDEDGHDDESSSDEDDKKDVLLPGKEKFNKNRESTQLVIANKPCTQTALSAKTIKDELIDLDSDDDPVAIVSKVKKSVSGVALKQNEPDLSDEELLKKEEAALEKLKEDIAHEEKVHKMKRERDALQERIDAARSKKRARTG